MSLSSFGADSWSCEFDPLRTAQAEELAIAKSPEAERYSSALEAVSDAATAAEPLDIQRKAFSLQGLKSWATILVPPVSVLGLSATIWTQAEQLRAYGCQQRILNG